MPDSIAPGFDSKWQSAADYCLGITREIWDEHRADAVATYFADDMLQRAPSGLIRGRAAISNAVLATLAEFPDGAYLGEDVFWARNTKKDADGRIGLVTSQRATCLATHSGSGLFGEPNGTPVRFRIMSERWCAQNQVQDEWTVRDHGAIVRQLGRDPAEWARDLIAREGGPNHCADPLSPETDIDGPYGGQGTKDAVSSQLADILKRIMSGELGVVAEQFDRSVETGYPGGETSIGQLGVERFWLGLRSAFPSAGFRIEHRIGMEDEQSMPRAAIRWSLYGKHDGFGAFGAPTGAYVYIMGITHAEFGPRGLRREWTLIDETAIWKQIVLATG